MTTDALSHIEAPITPRAYVLCAFAAFGGILFGYDSGYISGVLGMDYFKKEFGHPVSKSVDGSGYLYYTWEKSLITSILSAGTFLGALVSGSIADWIGRRYTVIVGSGIFTLGVVLQVASTTVGLLVAGRLIAGLGVGFISAIVILYMSETAPKRVRGTIVSGYQFSVTVGLLLAACVDQATHKLTNSASYRVPIAIQFLWAMILGIGFTFLPESPRWYIKEGKVDKAGQALSRIRGQSDISQAIRDELDEIVASYEYEISLGKASWWDCFKGGMKPSSNLRRVILGIGLQMFQQWTGVNFIFYYGTTFFQQVGISNPFIFSVVSNVVNVASTPVALWSIERCGRRPLLIWGAVGMLVCEFIVAAVGTAMPSSNTANTCLIVFVCVYIFFIASTWGPAAWTLIGEIYPLPIRAKGVAMSTASNWLWNFVIGYITPYMVDKDSGNLGAKVFFLWGSTCTLCVSFAYFMVPETKGLSLEQVEQMLEESTPVTSSLWIPHTTFVEEKHRSANKADVEHQP